MSVCSPLQLLSTYQNLLMSSERNKIWNPAFTVSQYEQKPRVFHDHNIHLLAVGLALQQPPKIASLLPEPQAPVSSCHRADSGSLSPPSIVPNP